MGKLLDKALNSGINKRDRNYSAEELELVEAWLEGTIGISQVYKALGMATSGNAYPFLAAGAREIWQKRLK